MIKKEKNQRKHSILTYIFVSIGCFILSRLVVNVMIEKGADFIYKITSNKAPIDIGDDWGPEIVKTSDLEGVKNGKL